MLNTAWTGIGTGWAMLVSLISLPLMLHGLGTDAFGTWVLLNTFSAMTGWFSLADIGVGVAATRAIAGRVSVDDGDGARQLIASAVTLFVVLGVGFGLLFGTIGPVTLPDLFNTPADLVGPLRVAIVVYAVQVVVDQASNALQASLDGMQRIDLSRGADGARRTLVAIGVTGVALGGGGLEGVAVASLVASAGGLVVAVLLMRRVERSWWRTRPQRDHMKGLIRSGRSMAVLKPIGVFHRQMDRLVVGAILGPAAVTLVEIATQIQNGAETVLGASSYAVLPAASWVRAREDQRLLRELILRGTKYSLVITLPMVVAGMLLAGPIVAVWVGPAQAEAAGLAVLALAYTGITAPVQVSSNVLVGIGRAPAVLLAAAGAIVINLVVSIVLVRQVGICGAFIGTLLGGIFLVPFLLRAILRETEMTLGEFFRESIRPEIVPLALLAFTVGAVVVSPLGNLITIVVAAAAGGLVYLVATLKLAMAPDEVSGLRAAFSRQSSTPSGPGAGHE